MTNAIEQTKREMYDQFAEIKSLTEKNCVPATSTMDCFEGALEGHLEALRQRNEVQREIIEGAGGTIELSRQLAEMRQERDEIQGRLHAIDSAHFKLDKQNADLANLNALLTDAHQNQKNMTSIANREVHDLDDEIIGLKNQLERLTEERDELRNKLQAFEFANKSAGEFLIDAQEILRSEREVMANLQAKVKRQRQSIGQLKNARNNAQTLAAVNYQKYQKTRQELSELRKSLMATPAQDSKENAKNAAYIPHKRDVDVVVMPQCSHSHFHKHYIGYCPHCGAGPL